MKLEILKSRPHAADGNSDPSFVFDQFMKALYNFIQKLPELKNALDDIHASLWLLHQEP